jgi:V/A-type H+/Na+-transporting ATPase subunit I
MTTRKMKKLELHVLASDIDGVLEYLGKKEIFQIDFPEREGKENASRAEGAPNAAAANLPAGSEEEGVLRDLEAARTYLGIEASPPSLESCSLPGEKEKALHASLMGSLSALKTAEEEAKARLESVREALEESRAFSKLKMPYAELELLTFIVMRIGLVAPEKLSGLRESLGGRAVIIELDDSGRIAALSSKKGRFALDTELKNSGFVAIELPKDFQGVPDGLIEKLEAEEADAVSRLESADAAKRAFALQQADFFPCLIRGFSMAGKIQKTKRRLDSSEQTYSISGWTPKDSLKALVDDLGSLTGGRIAIRSFDPMEIASVRSGKSAVPVSITHGKFMKSFEPLVFSYGTPLYGSIDPTPMVAVFFVLLFSIMFGDVGQGFVIFLVGLYLAFGKKGPFPNWKKFAAIFMAIGLGSMTMGLLVGSVFSNEELLAPLTRSITRALFGKPMDRIVSIMPTSGVGRIFAFFGFTVGVGVVINSIGLCVNMVNLFRRREFGKMLFTKTGLAGSLFFWYVVAFAGRILLKLPVFWWDAIAPGLCLILLFLGESLERLIEGKKPLFPDGFLSFIIQGLVEIIESISYYASNTVSFLRVGAFALSHAVLSFIVFTMGDLIRGGIAYIGPAMQLLVLILGNAVILVLEGMVVAIQVVRLQYYEFFSKFFSETGSRFKPFSFTESANR